MVIYSLTNSGDDWFIFLDARVLTRTLWMDGRWTDGPTHGHILPHLSKPLLGLLVGYFSNILGYKKVFSHLGTTKKPEDVREALECCVCAPAILESQSFLSLLCFKKKLLSNNFNFMEFGNFTDQITDGTFVGYNVNPSVYGQ